SGRSLNVRHGAGIALGSISHHAVVVSEVELSDIPVQMLNAYMVKRANQAALEDAEIALNRVGMRVPARVLPARVVESTVASELAPDLAVVLGVIRHQVALLIGLLVQHATDSARRGARNMEAANVATALNQRDNDVLVL